MIIHTEDKNVGWQPSSHDMWYAPVYGPYCLKEKSKETKGEVSLDLNISIQCTVNESL